MSEDQAEPKSPWVNHYHVIVPNASTNDNAPALLMLPTPDGWQLPYARAEGIWFSEAAKIIPAVRAALGLDFPFTVLRYAHVAMDDGERWDRQLLVLEPTQPLDPPPLGGQWIDYVTLQTLHLAAPKQRAPLLRYLAEQAPTALSTNQPIDPRRAPWARPGWFANAAAWITAAIAEQGSTLTGPVEQLRNWSISSLLYAPTTAGRVYFKAAAALPFFVNEPALTETLAELFPNHIPTPLKISRHRQWMLMRDFGTPEWDDEQIDLAPILRAYGELQRASSHHLDKLVAAGCINRTLDVLASQIDPLIVDPTTQAALSPQEYAELVTLAPRLKARCAEVAAYNLPATLVHGDLHLGNITQSNSHYIFFDWTDAAISFPFLDLFMLYFRAWEGQATTQWRDAYLDVWRDFESPSRLLALWELAKPLCALHHAISYLTIVNHIEPLTRTELSHGLPNNLHHLLAAMRAEPTP